MLDLVGNRFGMLIVDSYSHKNASSITFWDCLCDCGNQKTVPRTNLVSGNTRSCGCEQGGPKTHGSTGTTERAAWKNMLQRCNNPKSISYPYYGGRGITVCDRWLVCANFLLDMGIKPSPEYSLDRIDNDGNYEPNNCRWATRIEQDSNRRYRTRRARV